MADQQKPGPTASDALQALQSIDRTLQAIAAHFGVGAKAAAGAGPAVGAIASDGDLDGKYGDPEIKMADPRDWTGESMKGRHMSECPPEYLDMLASRWDYFTEKSKDELTVATAEDVEKLKKSIFYNSKDAARARGWAARKRNGWTAPAPEPISAPPGMTDDEIPF